MEVRDKHILLSELLDFAKFLARNGSFDCLCSALIRMTRLNKISKEESNLIRKLIFRHRPKGKLKFQYWWPDGELDPRVKFLDRLIKKYTPNEKVG